MRTVFACSFELCIKTKLVFLHSTGHVIICESHCHFRRYFRPLLLLVATTVTTAACLEPPRTERLLPDHFSRKKQATATSAAVAVGEPCQHTPHTHTHARKSTLSEPQSGQDGMRPWGPETSSDGVRTFARRQPRDSCILRFFFLSFMYFQVFFPFSASHSFSFAFPEYPAG